MRITRLLAIVGLSYLGYRLYRQMEERGEVSPRAYRKTLREALDEDSGRLQTLTGPSHRGATERVGDASGAMGQRIVGRGVVET